jgi:hypothetical protein
MYANSLPPPSQGRGDFELSRGCQVYHQRVPCLAGLAMMSPSAISFLLRILEREGKLLERQMGKLLDRSLS